MPIKTNRQAEVFKKLQDVIKHTDRDIAAGRKLAIKRWAETYIENIKSFKNDKLEFLYNVFRDEGCWLGTRLNNTVLRQRFTEEKIGEIDNPLRMYEMACSYCVVGKILPLFQKAFESYKSHFSSDELDGTGNPITDKYIRNSLLSGIGRKSHVFTFWIDKESGELKQPSNAVEGFDSAVKLKWSEGVEYFYNHLKEEDKEKKLTEAIIALSRPQSVGKDAPILDFCVRNIADKDTLLQKLLREDKKEGNYSKVYSLLAELIDSCFFDTVHDLVQCWCYKDVSAGGDCSDKIFSQREYELLLSSLSRVMLKNPESSVQARSVIMKIWGHDSLDEYKRVAVDTSNYTVHISGMLAGLIVNWKREGVCKTDEEKKIEKKEILDIISFAKSCFPEKFDLFKEVMIKNLRLCGREGMAESINYDDLAKELFSELEREPLPARNGDSRVIVQAEDPSFSRSPIRHDASGDGPGSEFKSPGVSSASSSKRKRLPDRNYASGDGPGSELESPDVSPSGSPERKKPFTPSGNK